MSDQRQIRVLNVGGHPLCAKASRPGVERPRADCQLTTRSAPMRRPVLGPEDAKVPMREIRPNFGQVTALDCAQSVLRNPRDDRDVPNPAGWTRLLTPRAERLPADIIFAAIERVLRQGSERLGQCSSQLAVE